MGISSYNSKKFKVLSFIMCFFILVIHGRYIEAETMTIPYCLQSSIGNGLCRVAVPTFFFMSGYLFFLKIDSLRWLIFKHKILTRVKTLLVPYFLWMLIFVSYFVLLRLLKLEQYVNNTEICDKLIELFQEWNFGAVLWYLYATPVNCVMWYVRDLFLFALFSPAIYIIISNRYLLLTLVIGLSVWIIFDYGNSIDGLIFFVVGGYIAVNNRLDRLQSLSEKLFLPSIFLFIAISVFVPYNDYHVNFQLLLHVCGFLSCWHLYDKYLNVINIPESWLSYSFFIYCFHMPFYTILKKLDVILFGDSWYLYCIYYILNPIVAIVLFVYIGKLLHTITPSIYKTLTGGR